MLGGVAAIAGMGRVAITGTIGAMGVGDSRPTECDPRGDRSGWYGDSGKWDNVLRLRELSQRGDRGGSSRSDLGARSGKRSPMQACECCGCQHFEDPGFGV